MTRDRAELFKKSLSNRKALLTMLSPLCFLERKVNIVGVIAFDIRQSLDRESVDALIEYQLQDIECEKRLGVLLTAPYFNGESFGDWVSEYPEALRELSRRWL
jgi:hypothetical protein